MRSCGIQLLAIVVGFAPHLFVRAQDEQQTASPAWPRFHVGLAVGRSQLGTDLASVGASDLFLARFGNTEPDEPTGFKVFAGFRPARAVGAEIEYIDFGEAEPPAFTGNGIVHTHAYVAGSAQATVLTSLLFIPERSSIFDVYGKVGVAKLKESVDAHALIELVSPCLIVSCIFSVDEDEDDWRGYAGFGARLRLARGAALRLEYEAIDRDEGDNTSMLSIGFAGER